MSYIDRVLRRVSQKLGRKEKPSRWDRFILSAYWICFTPPWTTVSNWWVHRQARRLERKLLP